MALVYAIIHNGNGDFIICTKNVRGYFFHSNAGGGSIIPAGQLLRGGGLNAFPGGTPDVGGIVDGAREEAEEELAIELGTGNNNPATYIGNGGEYYGVYFNVGVSFDDTRAEIAAHLLNGRNAARAVVAGHYTQNDQYEELMNNFSVCPPDNELASAEVWNVFYNSAEIDNLRRSRYTDWFYNMIINLEMALFPIVIKDFSGRTVGIAKTMAIYPGPQYSVDYILFNAGLDMRGQYSLESGGMRYRNLVLDEMPNQRGFAMFRPYEND
jgi:hypothetical protein